MITLLFGLARRPLAYSVIAAALTPWGGEASAQQALQPRALPQKPALERMQAIPSSNKVIVKFREGSGFRLRGGQLSAAIEANVSRFQAALGEVGVPVSTLRPLFDRPAGQLSAERLQGQQRSGVELADLSLYYSIEAPAGTPPAVVAAKLNALDIVELAEPGRSPSPPPADPTPNLTGNQRYKNDPPQGVGALAAARIRGSDGGGMSFADVEYSWQLDHEDLVQAENPLHVPPGCVVMDPFNNTDHGTAVLGEIIGVANTYGVTGIAPKARALVIPANCTPATGDYNPANAINVGASLLSAGDVIVIEQQTAVCGGACGSNQLGCGPLEAWQPVFDAVRNATALGRIVVAAAGNGQADLDGAACGGAFDRNVRDSGAIIVGAGSPTDHARLGFSSFGSRVDVQGWGLNVATTGYGDAFNPGDERRRYTNTFSGTSSATPIVAGVVLSINGTRRACGLPPAGPTEMRTALSTTGTPQFNPNTGHIGPLPDIRAALGSTAGARECLRRQQLAK